LHTSLVASIRSESRHVSLQLTFVEIGVVVQGRGVHLGLGGVVVVALLAKPRCEQSCNDARNNNACHRAACDTRNRGGRNDRAEEARGVVSEAGSAKVKERRNVLQQALRGRAAAIATNWKVAAARWMASNVQVHASNALNATIDRARRTVVAICRPQHVAHWIAARISTDTVIHKAGRHCGARVVGVDAAYARLARVYRAWVLIIARNGAGLALTTSARNLSTKRVQV